MSWIFNTWNNEIINNNKITIVNNNKKTKDKNRDNLPYLEITEVLLVHCNIDNDEYQQNLRVLYTFTPKESFGQLLDILSKFVILLKTLEFLFIEAWFSDKKILNY